MKTKQAETIEDRLKSWRVNLLGFVCVVVLLQAGCVSQNKGFAEDVVFMEKHTPIVLLTQDGAAVAVAPAYQGRVMTTR